MTPAEEAKVLEWYYPPYMM